MYITIVGGGNIGTQFAVHCAHKKHDVTVFTSKPQKFSLDLECTDTNGNVTCQGRIRTATNHPAEAFSNADVIFITIPADCMAQYAELIVPYIKPGTKIGLIPGTGGGECVFGKCLSKGAVLFGLQRVPAVARIAEYGKQVCSTGYRPELYAAALPKKETGACCSILESIFDIRCTPLPDYLNLTLTPSNPILHTTRLRTLYKDYRPGVVYSSIPLFYQDWDDESSRLLIACDTEVQQLCKALKQFDLSGVKSLKVHYESDTAEKLTKKISSIPAFQGLPSPQIPVDNGWLPDFSSRYFTADFSYGLAILVQIAHMASVPVPNMDETLQWYLSLTGSKEMFRFDVWDIRSLDDLLHFYLQ